MSAPVLPGVTRHEIIDASDPGLFTAELFDRDPQTRQAIASAAWLAMEGAVKLEEADDPVGLKLLAEAQTSIQDCSPYPQAALGSYAMRSLVTVGLNRLEAVKGFRVSGQEDDSTPVTAKTVRQYFRTHVRPAINTASLEGYAAGPAAARACVSMIVAEAMLVGGNVDSTNRLARQTRTTFGQLARVEHSRTINHMRKELNEATDLAASRAPMYRDGVQDERIATAREIIMPSDLDLQSWLSRPVAVITD